jgi:hypothetical protein
MGGWPCNCIHSPITLSPRGSKDISSPSLDGPIVVYKPRFEFEMSKIKPLKVK